MREESTDHLKGVNSILKRCHYTQINSVLIFARVNFRSVTPWKTKRLNQKVTREDSKLSISLILKWG